ncbi:4-oxalocrotonate tautomerase [candidate division WOR-3 bacterium]|uniref:4-oxalocrotonate tautomerase n=1 Tax=candidate division WOR-3 bacterium TaxID=2052148 RepID=A0A9D5KAC3_UNCW3|nr:4-oxalocrotonate tautomerase [candidate division WOR-3 bacterium]MBD3365177.1 4-oxalocrotonate tautomerase [candidate division WOR-3 bacterium]
MPVIQVDGPPLDTDKKRAMVKELTEVASRIYGIPHIVVLIRENQPENVGSNGELIADIHKGETPSGG